MTKDSLAGSGRITVEATGYRLQATENVPNHSVRPVARSLQPVALCCLLLACAQPPPARLVILAGRVFDGDGSLAKGGKRIVISKGVIEAVESIAELKPGASPHEPEGTIVLDAKDSTVMPGLIDLHVHLLHSGACAPVPFDWDFVFAQLQALADGGITTAVLAGIDESLGVRLRDYVGARPGRGPRLQVAGPWMGMAPEKETDGLRSSHPLDQVAEAMLRHAELAADLFALRLDGATVPLQVMTVPQACEAVGLAKKHELRTLAWASTRLGMYTAARCRADALLFGANEVLDVMGAEALATAGVVVAPQLFSLEAALWGHVEGQLLELPEFAHHLTPEVKKTLLEGELRPIDNPVTIGQLQNARANVAQLLESKVPLAFASGAGGCYHFVGEPFFELRQMVRAGILPRQALAAATSGSARALGLDDALGYVRVGYRADLLIVGGMPDVRIEEIRKVERVIIDGIVRAPAQGSSVIDSLSRFWLTFRSEPPGAPLL